MKSTFGHSTGKCRRKCLARAYFYLLTKFTALRFTGHSSAKIGVRDYCYCVNISVVQSGRLVHFDLHQICQVGIPRYTSITVYPDALVRSIHTQTRSFARFVVMKVNSCLHIKSVNSCMHIKSLKCKWSMREICEGQSPSAEGGSRGATGAGLMGRGASACACLRGVPPPALQGCAVAGAS